MERGVARQQAGRMHGKGSGQTAGRQDACREECKAAGRQDACSGEWLDSRQAGCMQRRVVRQQAGRMHAEGSG